MNNHLDSSALDDGFTAAHLFSQGYSYTYDDVIFHPDFIDFPADAVDLSTRISKHLPLSIPCVASPMDTISETSMAVAMASLGDIAIVHSNCSPSRQSSILRSAKSHCLPFAYDPSFLSPSDSVTELDFATSNFLIVTESGSPKSKPIGIVVKSYWEKLSNKDAAVSTYMQPVPKSCSSSSNFEQVAAFLADEKLEVAPIVSDDGKVLDLVTDDIVEKIRSYPKLGSPSLGGDGKFLVGAAIGTREDDKERLEALVSAGANVIVVDSSQGNSSYQIDMIKYVFLISCFTNLCLGQTPIPTKLDGFFYGKNIPHAGGDSVMVEAFLDPMCPDSRDSWPPLKQALRYYSPHVVLIVHPFPLPYHSNSYTACRALHIANKLNSSSTYPLLELFFKYQVSFVPVVQNVGMMQSSMSEQSIAFTA